MIKFSTIGMYDVAKINPVLTSESDVTNHSIITVDGIVYLVNNTLSGDMAYVDEAVIKAGEYLCGYQLDAHVGQDFIIGAKHIKGTATKDKFLTIESDGKVKAAEAAASSGLYFKVADKTLLGDDDAVKATLLVA